MASLAEIRARLAAQETKKTGGGDNAVYAFWNAPEGSTSVVRFLPDADPNNVFFWVERQMIRLPFSGIAGDPSSKPLTVQVPCVEMWQGTSCPILTEVRTWFKDPGMEDMGRKYWKKRSYIYQGFVVENAVADDESPENPIRRFPVNPSIHKIISSSLMDPELEEIPTDYQHGLDFRITKTARGDYADYSTSKWSRKERALSQEEQAAIDTYGLFDLKDYLPNKPTDAELQLIFDMFESSVNGDPYDLDRFGSYYDPTSFSSNRDSRNKTAETPPKAKVTAPKAKAKEEAPVETPAEEVAEEDSGSQAKMNAQDILQKIRNRPKVNQD